MKYQFSSTLCISLFRTLHGLKVARLPVKHATALTAATSRRVYVLMTKIKVATYLLNEPEARHAAAPAVGTHRWPHLNEIIARVCTAQCANATNAKLHESKNKCTANLLIMQSFQNTNAIVTKTN